MTLEKATTSGLWSFELCQQHCGRQRYPVKGIPLSRSSSQTLASDWSTRVGFNKRKVYSEQTKLPNKIS